MTQASFYSMVYFNTRVRVMKSVLYPARRLRDVLETDSVDMLIETLLQGPYAAEMAQSLTRHTGADAVEDAVSRNLSATFRKLLAIAPADVRPQVKSLLMRWDLIAVKALLRARHVSAGGEAYPEGVLPGPTLEVPLLERLAQQHSMRALVSAMRLWNMHFGNVLAHALHDYESGGGLQVLEDALDRAYYVAEVQRCEAGCDDDSMMLRQLLQMEIDRINLRSMFTRRGAGALSADDLVAGGTLSRRVLSAMAAAPNMAVAMEFLEPTMYRELVERLYQYIQSRRFSPFERLFDTLVMRRCRQLAAARPFSIAVAAHYVWLKYNEAMNLRLIARGEAGHLPRGRVLEEMAHA